MSPSSSPWLDGWKRHGPTCICRSCQSARRRAERERERERVKLVPANETARHIAKLVEQGWSLRAIAKAANVSPSVAHRAANPLSSISSRTRDSLLAVR